MSLGNDDALQKVYDTFMKVASDTGIAVDRQQEKFSLNLDREEYGAFLGKISVIQEGKGAQLQKSANGECIFAIGNKLVYTDGDYEDPRINRIISIHLSDETDIDFTQELVYDSERGENQL